MNPEQSQKGGTKPRIGVRTILISVILPVLILAGGAAVTMHFMKTSPKAVPRKKPVYVTLVQVETISFSSHQTTVNGMGSVVAAREVDLKPRVGGDVIYLDKDVMPGGVLEEGQTILKIDPADYDLKVKQLESEVAKVEADLVLEMGNQRVAKTEFELLGEDAAEEEKALMLRIPQLKQKEAALKSSRSKLAEATLDLKRTELRIPFDSVIRSKSVELGSRVTESTPVVHLIGTDSFWVQVGIPVEKLSWIRFPDKEHPDTGFAVKIFPGTNGRDNVRIGRVIRLAADLEESGRMAKVIVEVDDPLCLLPENIEKTVLFLGSYVRAEIEGRTLNQVYSLNREHVRDNNTIWLLGKDSTLEIRSISPMFKGPAHLLIEDGVNQGEKIIVSNIATPVAGMKVRVEGQGAKGSGMKRKRDGEGNSGPPSLTKKMMNNSENSQQEAPSHVQ